MPSIPAPTLERLFERGRQLWHQFEVHVFPRNHLVVPCDHAGAYAVLQELAPRTPSLLELGSATGVVAIMADLLGMEGYGIEIEPWMVAHSTDLAAEFRSEATFVEGSFVPRDYRDAIENLPSDRLTPTEGACGYEELGLELEDFDLVFAYPWPGEEDWLHEMMRRFARPDAILLTHGATDGFRADVVGDL